MLHQITKSELQTQTCKLRAMYNLENVHSTAILLPVIFTLSAKMETEYCLQLEFHVPLFTLDSLKDP